MLLRIIIGNAVFAICVWSWHAYVHGNKQLFMHGTVFAGICFVLGMLVGAWATGEAHKQSAKKRRPTFDSARVAENLEQMIR